MDQEIKMYKTSDITIAACLIMSGFKMLRLEPVGPTVKNKKVPKNHFYFVFQDGPDREKIVMGYLDKSLKLVPSDLMDNIRRLKQQTKEMALSDDENE